MGELRDKLARLAPYRIGAKGQLQEWREDYAEEDPKHRHLSHLYGLHPGNQINPDTTPVLFRAGKLTRAGIRSKLGGNCRLRTHEPVEVGGVTVHAASGENPNSFYRIVDAGKPLVSAPGAMMNVRLRPTTTVDFPTEPGGAYTIMPAR